MATKKLKGLGRGLEALLGGDGDFNPAAGRCRRAVLAAGGAAAGR